MKHYSFILLCLYSLLSCTNELKPENNDLRFKSPTLNQKLANDVEVTLVVSTTTPMQKTDFYLDGQRIGTPTISKYGATWTPKRVSAGTHTLSAVSLTAQNSVFQAECTVIF